MKHGPETRSNPAKRRRARRLSGRFLSLVLVLVIALLLLGFRLWEVGMAILLYIYLGWCFKS